MKKSTFLVSHIHSNNKMLSMVFLWNLSLLLKQQQQQQQQKELEAYGYIMWYN
jgi:hypothetical protein